MDVIWYLFSWVCGQGVEHTWSPGGLLLPCCQRCTGLYAGACIAAVLHFWLEPRLSGRFLEVHAAFLLLMVPFGFHWLAQGPWARTATGVLFGFGVVTFLWLVPGAQVLALAKTSPRNKTLSPVAQTSESAVSRVSKPANPATAKTSPTWKSAIQQVWKPALRGNLPRAIAVYYIGLVFTTLLVPTLARFGNAQGAVLLTGLGLAGLFALTILVAANAVSGVLGCARILLCSKARVCS